jgi:hypothetical protein
VPATAITAVIPKAAGQPVMSAGPIVMTAATVPDVLVQGMVMARELLKGGECPRAGRIVFRLTNSTMGAFRPFLWSPAWDLDAAGQAFEDGG